MSTPTRIAQIALPVQDLGRATAFYRDVVGLPLMFEVPNLTFFNLNGVRLMLGAGEGERAQGASIIYYAVDDVREEHAAIVARGAGSFQAPHVIARLGDRDVWMAFYTDSEGNAFALTSEHVAPTAAEPPATAA